nr:MAG TPA: hypothetical protein [Caudoviricetes sp.]DAX04585.1 MAG TPA: hypothetical protein [Bacteriophage sp.]
MNRDFLNRFTFCHFPLRLLFSAMHRFFSGLLRVRLLMCLLLFNLGVGRCSLSHILLRIEYLTLCKFDKTPVMLLDKII